MAVQFKYTSDNRLTLATPKGEVEVSGYITAPQISELQRQLTEILIQYNFATSGHKDYLFLTAKERSVFNLMRQGKRQEEIALLLKISPSRVSRFMKQIRYKFHLFVRDCEFKPQAEIEYHKIYVKNIYFSSLITDEEDLESFEEVFVNDGGQQSRDALNKCEADDLVNLFEGVDRQIITLLDEGFEIKEIAKKLSLTPNAVYKRVNKIRQKLIKDGYHK